MKGNEKMTCNMVVAMKPGQIIVVIQGITN